MKAFRACTMLFANLLAGILCFGAPNVGDGNLRAPLPGRRVKVATIAIGRAGNRNSDQHEKKLRLALEHLETAGQQGVDIACLPEEFCGTTPEPIPGPITQAVAELANKYHMYVVCPMCERTADGLEYNTAALLDRTGAVAGRYREVFVWWGEGLHPGREGVPVFDTDFGRLAIDILGKTIEPEARPRPQQFIATLDLDRTLVHKDFNEEKMARLLAEHRGEVELEPPLDMENWYLLHSLKPGILARDLCKQYRIETLREYRHRSREQINDARVKGKTI